jgi:hypothetical protein
MHCAEMDPTAHITAQQAEELTTSKKDKASAVMGNVLLGCYLVVIAAVVLYLAWVLVWARRERNAANATSIPSNSTFTPGDLTKAKGAVGCKALDADGSGMLGYFSIDGGAENGNMELTLKDKEDGAAGMPGIV